MLGIYYLSYADHNAVQRGCVQHEVLEGDKAVAFQKDDNLILEITCTSPTEELLDKVSYGLVVTLEVCVSK